MSKIINKTGLCRFIAEEALKHGRTPPHITDTAFEEAEAAMQYWCKAMVDNHDPDRSIRLSFPPKHPPVSAVSSQP